MPQKLRKTALILILYIGVYCLVFPQTPLFLNDEYFYVDSIVSSLRSGHLTTAADLKPTTLGLTWICTKLFQLSGNFYAATYGVLFFSTLGVLIFTVLIFRKNRREHQALALTMFLISSPVFLFQGVEFKGVMPYLCLFAAALYFRQRLWIFIPCALAAASIRQMGLALFLMPLFEALRPQRRLVLHALFLTALWLIVRSGFQTTSSAMIGAREYLAHFTALLLALGPLVVVIQALTDEKWPHFSKKNAGFAVAILAFAALLCDGLNHLQLPTTVLLFQTFSQALGLWTLVIIAALFLIDYHRLRWNAESIAVLAMLLLAATQPTPWDYYLLDIRLLLALSLLNSQPTQEESELLKRRAVCIATALAAALLPLSYAGKIFLDKSLLSQRVYEKALRAKLLQVPEASYMPAGMRRWVTRDTAMTEAQFQSYWKPGKHVVVQGQLPWRRTFREESPEATVLDSGVAKIGFWTLPYRLIRLTPAIEKIDDNQRRELPLSNAEWNVYILKMQN